LELAPFFFGKRAALCSTKEVDLQQAEYKGLTPSSSNFLCFFIRREIKTGRKTAKKRR